MDNQLRLLATTDPTLSDAAEQVYACECELARLKHAASVPDADEWAHHLRVLEGQRGEAEARLAPHVPPSTWILVGHAPYQWELYRHPQTGRISSTPHRPDPEPDDLADLEDVGGWHP